MLVIRMQRTGRRGHAQFRVVVQDSRRTPTSGKIVAALGHFNPHTKETSLDKEKAAFYLEHGAQPSDRVVRLLQAEGVKLPKWVAVEAKKQGTLRNPEKLRKNRPADAEPAKEQPKEETEVTEAPVEEAQGEAAQGEAATEEVADSSSEASADTTKESAAEESAESESATEQPAEESAEVAAETQAEEPTESDENSEESDKSTEEPKQKA